MTNFKELFESQQNENIINKISKKIRRFFSAGDKIFIAPYLKGVKLGKQVEYKEYQLFVDRDEAIMWYKEDGTVDGMSIPDELFYKTEQLLKKYENKMQFEEDTSVNRKYYAFITGIGKESDIKDFVKEKLKGVDYAITKWEF